VTSLTVYYSLAITFERAKISARSRIPQLNMDKNR